ncbi:polysaccharide deacetylase family protein [Absiella sp. AM29-15]|nr:polysaccharide deacetylase family protein [Absiella sp. AM29-15]
MDSTEFYHPYVQVNKEAALYQLNKDEYEGFAKVYPNVTMQLEDEDKQDMHTAYFKLKNQDVYVKAEDVKEAGALTKQKMTSRYLPFNESIITKDTYTIKDMENKNLVVMHQAHIYPIYMKDKDRIGVMIDDQMYFIDQQDIKETKQVENTKEEVAKDVPVFMYHYFYSKANGEKAENGNWLEVNDFEDQLKYLKEKGYQTVYMQDLEYFLDGKIRLPKKSVSLTVDDGTKSIYQYAYPLLKKYDMKATLFLITNKFKDGTLPDTFQEMKENGMELQSHSYAMHTGGCDGGHGGALRCVDLDTGIKDTKKSFSIIGGGFVYCYPYGDVTESALEIMKDSGVRMAFTTNYGKIEPGMDKLQLPRVRIFGESGLSQFIYSLDE